MPNARPFIDIEAVRAKLRRADARPGRMGAVWRYIKRLAYGCPESNSWLTPFVAVIENDAALAAHARRSIDGYLAQAEGQGSAGYLFNIWCFAFPHCRRAIWFDLMNRAGFYAPEEAARIAERFLLVQLRDHHAGLLIKPFPDCVDNQAAALVLSSCTIGSLFKDVPGGGHLARFLLEESEGRLEAMIGGMPTSGYSGEGSTYQGLIVGFAVPFLLEMLERVQGGDRFETPLAPNGTTARAILEMTVQLQMPGGLLLPWDHYGYQFGMRMPLAFLAARSSEARYLKMLEHDANWSRIALDSAGWGFDEPVWTLVHWPETAKPLDRTAWTGWAQAEVGAALGSPDGRRYLMQMWDPCGNMCLRSHVNPNSLVLEADGVPLTADGVPDEGCTDLHYPDAVFERNFGQNARESLDLSPGCAGSHNGLIVDGMAGMRPSGSAYAPSRLVTFDAEAGDVTADVTGLYRDRFPDCLTVRRRSRMPAGAGFWLVEDLAVFRHAHSVTSRWFWRPSVTAATDGIDLCTPEGVALRMCGLLGSATADIRRIEGFPRVPDGCSDRVDYVQSGRVVRWLWLLHAGARYDEVERLTTGWRARPAGDSGTGWELHPGLPPQLQQEVPPAETWIFERDLTPPAGGDGYLRLPRGLGRDTVLTIGGETVDFNPLARRAAYLPVFVPLPKPSTSAGTSIPVVLRISVLTGEAAKGNASVSCPDTPPALCQVIADPLRPVAWSYREGWVHARFSDGREVACEHRLMEETAR